MEIVLQGAPSYKIADWTGATEVEALKVYQYKRLANSRSSLVLFRKFLKVITGTDSPVKLPPGLEPKKLSINDFMQVLLGVALSHKTETQHTFQCEHCGSQNPRIVKLTKAYTFEAPKIQGGTTVITLADQSTIALRCLTIGDYLQVNDYVETLYTTSRPGDMQFKVVPRLQEKFGQVMQVQDEEDAEDLRDILEDLGMIAIVAERQGLDFDGMIKYLMALQGQQVTLFQQLDRAVQDLGPTMRVGYEDKCTACMKPFLVEVSPTAYFFDTP